VGGVNDTILIPIFRRDEKWRRKTVEKTVKNA
jgi:hypothetical protein